MEQDSRTAEVNFSNFVAWHVSLTSIRVRFVATILNESYLLICRMIILFLPAGKQGLLHKQFRPFHDSGLPLDATLGEFSKTLNRFPHLDPFHNFESFGNCDQTFSLACSLGKNFNSAVISGPSEHLFLYCLGGHSGLPVLPKIHWDHSSKHSIVCLWCQCLQHQV